MAQTKVCCACKQRKPVSKFGKKASASDGLQSRCVPCRRARAKEIIDAEIANPNTERFWSRVDKRGPDECWPWTSTRRVVNKQWTPMIYGEYASRNAHRIAWIIANGRQPKPKHLICHRCDNPLCCNPAHLFEGTHDDNMKDMKHKGRSGVIGEKNPNAKITEAIVREIRADECGHAEAGRKYGLDPSSIYNIRTRRKWRHVE